MDFAQSEAVDLRRMVVQLSRLVEISVTLNSTLDREALLRFIVRSASDVLEAEAAVILLIDPNTRALQAVASASSSAPASADASAGDQPRPATGITIPQEGSIAGTVLRERRALILNEVEAGQGALGRTPELARESVRTLLAVPINSRDEAVGVLEWPTSAATSTKPMRARWPLRPGGRGNPQRPPAATCSRPTSSSAVWTSSKAISSPLPPTNSAHRWG
jgi:transcriptional regulator with GAF, ATPase, and Fis domain